VTLAQNQWFSYHQHYVWHNGRQPSRSTRRSRGSQLPGGELHALLSRGLDTVSALDDEFAFVLSHAVWNSSFPIRGKSIGLQIPSRRYLGLKIAHIQAYFVGHYPPMHPVFTPIIGGYPTVPSVMPVNATRSDTEYVDSLAYTMCRYRQPKV
jgi:hypothetical protein